MSPGGAAGFLSEHGIEVGANIPGYATPGEGLRALLEAYGGCVTRAKVAKFYRKPNIVSQIRRGNVLAYCGRDGQVLVPVWQFTPKGSILRGIPAALKVLRRAVGAEPVTPFAFFLHPEPTLGMRTPLEALRNGEAKQVLAAATEHVRFFGGAPKDGLKGIGTRKSKSQLSGGELAALAGQTINASNETEKNALEEKIIDGFYGRAPAQIRNVRLARERP